MSRIRLPHSSNSHRKAPARNREADQGCEGVVQQRQTNEKKRYPQRMAAPPGNHEILRGQLERVLASACFGRSEGLSRLLRFLVERKLEGREAELKESLIGV